MAKANEVPWPRRWRLQFSLRLFLLAVLAFAVGFPLWYRWPYEEFKVEGTTRTTTTWQRQWGGGRLKHGPQTQVQSTYTWVTSYSQGVENGLYRELSDGEVIVSGQHQSGRRHGIWQHRWTGQASRTVSWRDGKLHGPYDVSAYLFQDPYQLQFDAGRLTHRNGQELENRLYELCRSGAIDNPRIAHELTQACECAFFDTPLPDAAAFLAKRRNIPVVVDPKAIIDSNLQVSGNFWEIDLCSALALITEPSGLACDYRYGVLWITTADDARDWTDSTGVSQLKPPPGTALDQIWSEPVSVELKSVPLTDALTELDKRLGVGIDDSTLTLGDARPVPQITFAVQDHPFRHVLGALLYQAGCCCEMKDDTLVIRPQD